jgi:hypothetical protein
MSLNIEVSALTQRNTALQADNAAILQRWIDKMNLTAEEMNEDFEKEQATNGGKEDKGKEKGKEVETSSGKGKGREGGEVFRNGGKAK